MKKTVVLLAIILCANMAQAGEWKLVHSGVGLDGHSEWSRLIDEASVVRSGRHVRIAELFNYDDFNITAKGAGSPFASNAILDSYLSSIQLTEYDCFKKRYRILNSTNYEYRMAEGRSEEEVLTKSVKGWKDLKAGTGREEIRKMICFAN